MHNYDEVIKLQKLLQLFLNQVLKLHFNQMKRKKIISKSLKPGFD